MPNQITAPTARADDDPRNMPTLMRGAELVPTSFNEADNTIDCTWTTGARVRRYDWWTETAYEEELVVDAASVDMSRFDAGVVQVLDGHNTYGGVRAILGIATKGTIANGSGGATLRLSTREELAGIVKDIKLGIIRSISFGYNVTKYEIIRAIDRTDGINMPLYRAVAWQPYEISFVTVPADANASTREQPANGVRCEFTRAPAHTPATSQGNNMSKADTTAGAGTPNPAPAEQQRVAPVAAPAPAAATAADPAIAQAATDAANRAAEITEMCTRHHVGNLAAGLIRSGNSIDQARAAVLDELARASTTGGGHQNVRVHTVTDEYTTRMAGMEEAFLNRVSPRAKLTDNGKQFRGMQLLEIGREMLEAQGVNTRGMDKMTLATRILQFRSGMHTTSDFGNLFANVATKRLRAAYDENAGTYTRWARRAPNAPDFKSMTVAQLSGAPDLLRTNEHGEFKYGTMTDGAESYGLLTFGRIVGLSRQSIVNDDLRAFDRLVTAYGSSASRLENRLVYSQLTANANLSDGVPLFHSTHNNLGSGAGSALQLSALGAARAAMRLQKGLQNEELNIVPSMLIVPTALEQLAYQLTSSNYAPAKQSDVNEFRTGGRTSVDPIIEPILDALSSTAWYMASESSQIDTVEYCYLDGAEGPVIESEPGFEVDGISYKCRLDFAAKAIDFRGLYKSPGA